MRTAVLPDAPAIAAVHVQAWREAYRGIVPQEYLDGLDVARREEGWARFLARDAGPRSVAFVAADGGDGHVVGFAHVAPARDDDATAAVGQVTCLYVLARAQRRGAGRGLTDAAMEAMRAAGYAEATLWVLAANTGARRFYEAVGWAPDGARRCEELGGTALSVVRYRRLLG